ncbi:MAG: 50S ribosomal protein L3 [Thermoprotei archaeon]|nr:MAG: 50S ribosomal protein L3 [Thermoprotei archaeon]
MMAKHHNPRRGSMGYYPRKRARSIIARVRTWVDVGKPQLLGFAGYKVGTLHVVKVEDNPNSPFYGQEVVKVATVVETPPLLVLAVRAYERTPYGLRSLAEVWAKELPKDLERVFTVPKKEVQGEQMRRLEEVRSRIAEVRVIVAMQPRKAGIHKKKPEVFEVKVGGSPEEALSYALNVLGKEVSVRDVFSEGQYVDVISITKGKGFQGVIKRFGVKEMPRWHKHRKGSRRIGSVGPQKPAIMFTTPFPGQLGFHQRTEYNKRILKIGDVSEDDINPAGGWPHYGLVRSAYVLLEGTVPGPPKRLVKMRFPVRPRREVREEPKIVYISTKPIAEGGGGG